MKLIDAQKYLAAAYTAGTNGRFKFCNLPDNLRGRTMFQQAVQELGYVVFDVNGYIWANPSVFPTPEMQKKTLEVYRNLVTAQGIKKEKVKAQGSDDTLIKQESLPDIDEPPTVPTATLEVLNILAVNLQKVLRNQEAIAKEFDVKLPKWVDM